jgi:hypothetical protein
VLHDNLIQSAAAIIPSATLLKFHILPKQRKYRLLFSAGRKAKHGHKKPSRERIQAIVKMKQRNPGSGCSSSGHGLETRVCDTKITTGYGDFWCTG